VHSNPNAEKNKRQFSTVNPKAVSFPRSSLAVDTGFSSGDLRVSLFVKTENWGCFSGRIVKVFSDFTERSAVSL
jgi:hypothetical protein